LTVNGACLQAARIFAADFNVTVEQCYW